MARADHRSEALAEVVRVRHLVFAELPQNVNAARRPVGAARVEHAVHGFFRRRANAIDHAEPAENQPFEVARFDQRELVKCHRAAGEQHLP